MSLEYVQLRTLVLDHLKAQLDSEIGMDGGRFLEARAKQAGLLFTKEDEYTTIEILHELYREGIINSGKPPSGSHSMSWPFYSVTSYGKKVLATTDYVPHDQDGYLKQFRGQIPTVDFIILNYLEEALACFKGRCLLAAAVMIGCAAEKAMLLLIEAFGTALVNAHEKAAYQAVIDKHWMISRKYEEFWKRLQQKTSCFPDALSDDIHTLLDRVFDLIRVARNNAGHPTGKMIDRETIRANFILFPIYCKRIYELLEYFSKNNL